MAIPAVRSASSDSLLEGLDESQRDAVTCEAAPLAILAGAGAGKTRVLTRRIAWQASMARVDPSHVLAVTFTRKAAGELRERLGRLGVERAVTAGTLHAVALAQLRHRAAEHGRTPPGLIDRKARLLVPLIGGRGAEAAIAAAEVAGEIEWAKARLVGPGGYAAAAAHAGRVPARPPSEVARIYEHYEDEKRRRRLVDFDDLIRLTADALERDAEFAATQRWRFRHLFVDEFQDVSPAQLRLLRGWLGDRSDLCVVGDPDQAVYTFAGAEPSLLARFPKHFSGARVVELSCNYRSSPEVLRVAEAVLADGGSRRTWRAAEPSGPAPSVTSCHDEDDEARRVAQRLREARARGVAWSAMAVLYRTNAQSAAFEEALARADIPYRVRGAGRFLERPEVAATLDALRRAARDAPGRSFADHLVDLSPEQPSVPEGAAPGTPAPSERDQDAEQPSVPEGAAPGTPAPSERDQHVHALVRLGGEYLDVDGGPGSVEGFVAYLSSALRGEPSPVGGDAVELLTFHRAKGLEFHTVCVTGLERGLVPISHADTPAARAEERRLLYVALTRAERALHLSHARQRTMGSRVVRRQCSPWLEPIEAAVAPVDRRGAGPSGAPTARSRLDQARDHLAAVVDDEADVDPALLEALVEWRRNLARASGVPAFVIFHDTTLRAVAEARPANRTELLGVPGIGPVKIERHGDSVLELVARHTA